jgi:uncharacterized membrane protein YfcA
MNFIHFGVVFVAGMVASSFGTLIGGASLITIPTLILLGLPPHTAIGTDRLGITGLGLAGWYKFHQKGMINYKISFMVGVSTLVGSLLGANLVLQINPIILKKLIAVVTVCILGLVAVKPQIGLERIKHVMKNREYVIGIVTSLLVGIYGGFYGAMAGTFLLYIFLFFFGQTFLESAANVKIPSFMMTMMAGLVFAVHGAIHYSLTMALFMGCFIGSYIGAHYSDRIGNVWIKRLFIIIVLFMVLKLLLP